MSVTEGNYYKDDCHCCASFLCSHLTWMFLCSYTMTLVLKRLDLMLRGVLLLHNVDKKNKRNLLFFSCLTVTVGVCVIFHLSFHLLSSWTLLTSLQHSFCLNNLVMGFSFSLGLSQFLSPLQVTLCPLPFPSPHSSPSISVFHSHTHVCTLTLSPPRWFCFPLLQIWLRSCRN